MIKLIDWGKHIRLGNWLFQWAFLNYISKKTGNEINLPNYFLWNYLNEPPIINNDIDYNLKFSFKNSYYDINEKNKIIKFFDENKDKIINIELNCFMQSEKWFKDDLEFIKTKLIIKKEEIQKVKTKYKYFFDKPTIGIGIRRGDFVGHNCFYQIPENWYINVLKSEFPDYQDYNIIIFSDDIDWCKKYYNNMGFYFAESNNTHIHSENFKHYHKDPMEQFILGTLCDNFIGGNSTFSWWQMWYVKNFNNGKVFHCGKNLAGNCDKEYKNPDFYPEDWILKDI